MRAYHFLSEGFGIEDIARRRLKVSRIADLNDPFELLGANLSDANWRRRFNYVKDNLDKNRGLLCFSRGWRNPVMWSHYANKHYGICLGFDVPDQCLVPVEYEAERIASELLADDASVENLMPKILCMKYEPWRYEDELRSFVALENCVKEGSLYFKCFDEEIALREVVLGPRCGLATAAVSEALGDLRSEVKIVHTRLAFTKYEVVHQQDQKLWK